MKRKSTTKKFIDLAISAFIAALIFIGLPLWRTSGSEKIYDENGLKVYVSDTVGSEKYNEIIDDCNQLLQKYEITLNHNEKVIFCASKEEFNKKSLFLHKDALGLNYNLSHCILMNAIDLKKGTVEARSELLNERPICSVLAHELTHSYELQQLGFVNYIYKCFKEDWKLEGFAEYVSETSSFPTKKALKAFTKEDDNYLKDNELEIEYFYFLSHLKIDYLLSYKNISLDDFWKTDYNADTLESEIRQAMKEKKYTYK